MRRWVGSPRTWVAGTKPSTFDMHREFRDRLETLYQPPFVQIGLSAFFTRTTDAATVLSWTTTTGDSDGMWSATVQPTRITVPVGWAGRWEFYLMMVFERDGTSGSNLNPFTATIRHNGAMEYRQRRGANSIVGAKLGIGVMKSLTLGEGEYVEALHAGKYIGGDGGFARISTDSYFEAIWRGPA